MFYQKINKRHDQSITSNVLPPGGNQNKNNNKAHMETHWAGIWLDLAWLEYLFFFNFGCTTIFQRLSGLRSVSEVVMSTIPEYLNAALSLALLWNLCVRSALHAFWTSESESLGAASDSGIEGLPSSFSLCTIHTSQVHCLQMHMFIPYWQGDQTLFMILLHTHLGNPGGIDIGTRCQSTGLELTRA